MSSLITRKTEFSLPGISDDARIGDHQWYISDLSKFKADYPEWPGITISLEETVRQIIQKNMEEIPQSA